MTVDPELAELPGLPRAAAGRWLRDTLDSDVADDWTAEVISGGLSNITYRIRWGTQRLVLRRPPLGHLLPRAHDMYREYRVLRALSEATFPVPEALAFCDDPGLIGATFYLMREVPGTVVRTPAQARELTIEQRRLLSQQLVDVLADLHTVDFETIGLADYGRRGGYAARQVRTWGEQWQRSRTRDLPDMDRLLHKLADTLPSDDETTLVHGDFRIDNTIVTTIGRPRIAAVLDWELSTLGHPVADLATMLTYWHDLGDPERELIAVAGGLTALPGFLTTRELAERYAARTGRALTNLDFHRALAAMKLAVILEGVHSRYRSGQSVGDGYDRVGSAVPVLVASGLRRLSAATS